MKVVAEKECYECTMGSTTVILYCIVFHDHKVPLLVMKLLSPYHEGVHVVGLGFQIATVGHSILLQCSIFLHRCNVSPLEELAKYKKSINLISISTQYATVMHLSN